MADKKLKYTTFDTGAGWIGVLGSARGLLRATLPQPSLPEARRKLGDSADQAARAPHLFEDLMERFKAYFGGDKISFADELDLAAATPFQRKVWKKTRLIPYGETRSYLWVAEQMGKAGAARAVGQALGENPLPIVVPCHRVIASNGGLGGYSGGLEMKRRLLLLEASAQGSSFPAQLLK